jgi:inorganic triphosphatase YgiF
MHSVSSREFELKLRLTPQELQRVDAHPALRDLTVGQPVASTLRSIYYDTPDHRLRQLGITLFLRSDGQTWRQTVQTAANGNGTHTVRTLESVVAGPHPDLESIGDAGVRRRIARVLQRSVLEPVFETLVERTTRQLHEPAGALELVLDQGTVRGGRAEDSVCEAQLELKSGTPECLLATAAKLFADRPVALARASKAERGYDLALGRGAGAQAPARAYYPTLGADVTCAEALSLFVAAATAQIEANRSVVLETDDPEGAHQLRIGLRRLRGALRAFRPLNDTASMRELEEHARALARKVGELRDADILIGDIYAPVAGALRDDPGLALLHAALLAQRAQKRNEVRAALAGSAWSTLELYLTLWPRTLKDAPALRRPMAKFARRALSKAWKSAARYGKRLDELDAEKRHDMRKTLKQLRYLAEFCGSLFPAKEVRRFIKELKSLQDAMGYVNDAATAHRLSAICQERCGESREARQATGYVLGWHDAQAAHMWTAAAARWRALEKRGRFWKDGE